MLTPDNGRLADIAADFPDGPPRDDIQCAHCGATELPEGGWWEALGDRWWLCNRCAGELDAIDQDLQREIEFARTEQEIMAGAIAVVRRFFGEAPREEVLIEVPVTWEE